MGKTPTNRIHEYINTPHYTEKVIHGFGKIWKGRSI